MFQVWVRCDTPERPLLLLANAPLLLCVSIIFRRHSASALSLPRNFFFFFFFLTVPVHDYLGSHRRDICCRCWLVQQNISLSPTRACFGPILETCYTLDAHCETHIFLVEMVLILTMLPWKPFRILSKDEKLKLRLQAAWQSEVFPSR